MPLSKLAQLASRRLAEEREARHAKAWNEARAAREKFRSEWMTAATAAESLDISTRTLRRWTRRGLIGCVRFGDEDQSPIRYSRSDVERLRSGGTGFSNPQRQQ